MRKFLIFMCALLPFGSLWAQEQKSHNSDLDAAIGAYAVGDLKKAKEHLLKIEWKGDSNSRFVDFLLSDIAVKEGDWPLAKERFTRAFENLPEGNEFLLAKNFSSFCDLNKFYEFEASLLEPFYETHAEYLKKDSLLAWYYAKALFKIGKKAKLGDVIELLWQNFSKDVMADGVDECILDKDCREFLRQLAKNSLNSDSPIQRARAQIVLGDTKDFKLPEKPSMGVLLWYAENFKGISDEDIENALELNPTSVFAWRAWYLLAQQCFEEQQYELAYNFASRAETLAPDFILDKAKIYILLGDSDRFLKQYKQAKSYYEKVVKSRECVGELVAEATYKMGLNAYEEKKWREAYVYFQYVFTAYEGFDFWSSRAYYYGAKAQLELGNNLGARNLLLFYLKRSKHRDTLIYNNAAALWSRIEIN